MPFVTKFEAHLLFDDIAYRVGGGSPTTAPMNGKIPYAALPEAFGRLDAHHPLLSWRTDISDEVEMVRAIRLAGEALRIVLERLF